MTAPDSGREAAVCATCGHEQRHHDDGRKHCCWYEHVENGAHGCYCREYVQPAPAAPPPAAPPRRNRGIDATVPRGVLARDESTPEKRDAWRDIEKAASAPVAAAPSGASVQTCPVCSGMGKQSRPPHIAGDVQSWSAASTEPYPCPACDGAGVLWPQREPRDESKLITSLRAALATERATLASAQAALADRDRHFMWDDRLRMEREIGTLATTLERLRRIVRRFVAAYDDKDSDFTPIVEDARAELAEGETP